MRRMLLRLCTALAITVWGGLGLAAHAGAYVYWSNHGGNAIERANLDGSQVNASLLATAHPFGVAISGPYVYWTNDTGNAIGRARLDGSDADPSFITGAHQPFGITIAGGEIYWANFANGTIGRAGLDGSGVDQSFISGGTDTFGVAVAGGSIYWTNDTNPGTIGRASLDGSGVAQSFITGAGNPNGITSDGTHLYWANNLVNDDSIGRAALDGTGVTQQFITGASYPAFVAVDAGHLYWVNNPPGSESIGRAALDGSAANEGFISGLPAGSALGLVVDDGPDTTPPTATITAPAAGATYAEGQAVAADYACADEPFGTGVASCVGSVAAGAPVDTSTPGTHSFAVTGTDNAGNAATTTVTYTVTAPAATSTAGSPPAATTAAPAPTSCPAGPPAWVDGTLGAARLGMTRAAFLAAYPTSESRGRGDRMSFVCLTPARLRVGYATSRLLGGRHMSLLHCVVWISTALPGDAVAGIGPGERLAAARRVAPHGHLLHVGLNDWYLASRGSTTLVLKVRGGVVQEVGLASRSLTQTRRQQARFMRSFG